DLAGLPLEGLERIEVYRGQVPALLGGQAIGGAVHLVSRTPDRPGGVSSVRAGHGSFGTWDAALGHAGGTARLRYRLSLSLRRTEGDFPYHDDNGTPLTSADDRVAQRRNNDVSRLGLLGRLAWRMGGWNLAAFADGGYREAGVPGTGSNQAGSARLESERALLDLAGSRQGTVDVQGRSYVLLQRERFADPHGELQRPGAAPSSSESLSFTGGGRLSAGFDLPATRVELGGELRQEVLSSAADSEAEAALAASTAAGWEGEHSRLSAALGLEPLVAAWGGLLRFGPALRLEHLRSRSSAGGDGEAGETLVSPRFGLQLGTGLWKVKANAGRYHRAPTFSELFGGQGTMWGNPELLAEEGDNLDLGATLELGLPGPLGPPGMLGVEAVVFRRQVRQMIVWMQTSQEMIQAANLGEARLIGAELSLQAGLPWGFGWRSAYSWLDPENLSPEPAYHGKQLPLRPVHDLDLGLSWSTAPAEPGQALLSCEYRVTVVSGSYLDPANLHPLPLRHLHSATLWVRPWRRNGPQLLVEGTNLLDRRVEQLTLTHRGPGDPAQVAAPVVDFIGYPLPGRSLFASLLWSLEEQR
ncbi:MAG: TonB-dependent receptor, partial [Deltaproteobacteria bacterium]|nr:TonB-dependent receptor [Deltaproteobacteria bacterium]